jgi:putative membrane protein
MRRTTAIASLIVAMPFAAALAAPLSKTDQMFVRKAAIGGMTEVQEGQAATTTASSSDVKAFGQKMVDDHTPNNQELASIASSKGITVPTDLDKMHVKQVDMLTKKTGTDFDSAYIKDQVMDHEAMEKVMQTEIDSGTDPDLKAFASKTLPIVQSHLAMAKGLKSS